MSGAISCKIHGSQIPLYVCEHLFNKFENGIYLKTNYIPLLNYHTCEDCGKLDKFQNLPDITIKEALKLPEIELEKLESEIKKIEDNLIRYAFCSKCYRSI